MAGIGKFVITGGGTGGHVFPALAIAEELRTRGHSVLYVGSDRGFEAKVVPPTGIPFFTVRSGAMKNQGLLKRLLSGVSVLGGCLSSLWLLFREKPTAVIGVGGYVSVPVCLAAFVLRIPLFLQEQNASVGMANRLLGKLARRIFLGFEAARSYFPSERCVFTGNPIRARFFDPALPAFDPSGGRILIMGGSQGARAINQAIVELLPRLMERYPHTRILHQTGPSDAPWVQERYPTPSHHEVTPFIADPAGAIARAALVICRSGALTVSELIALGRPAIFVPYPRRGQNDQTANAALVEQAGAGAVVPQGEGFVERLWESIQKVYNPDVLTEMQGGFSALRKPGAVASIVDQVVRESIR